MKELYLFVNPKAGRSPVKVDKIEETLRKNYDVKTVMTKDKKHTQSCLKSIKKGIVVVAGGDGTINTVVSSIVGKDVSIGIVPFGTTNILARELGIPLNHKKACERILEGKTKKIDVGKINNQYFICVAGIGLDAEIAIDTSDHLKAKLGMFAYILTSLWTMWRYKHKRMDININGKVVEGYYLMIGNIRYYGPIPFLKEAKIDDGLLEVYILKKKNILYFFRYFIMKHMPLMPLPKGVEYYRASKIKVEAEELISFHVDAEVGEDKKFDIRVMKKRVKIII